MEYGWRANKGIIEGLLKQAGETRNIPLGLSASEWAEGVKTGRWTAVDVTVHCLEQMLKYDSTLNAMISVSPDSIEEARKADKMHAEGSDLKALGIPVVVKDNIDVAGLPTTLGAAALIPEHPACEDAFIVSLLRKEGAVILGKSSLSEYASSGMSDNSLIGQTLNPYDQTRTPGGSSGGSAVAVAMEYAGLGLGTDGVNSVRSPASACSLIGLRPTKGYMSCRGAAPSSVTQDMCGILARTTGDIELAYSILSVQDPDDSASIPEENMHDPAFKVVSTEGRIALLKNNCGDHPDVIRVARNTAEKLKRAGFEVFETESPLLSFQRMLNENNVIRFEQKNSIDAWLSDPGRGYPLKSLEEYLNSGEIPADVRSALGLDLKPEYRSGGEEHKARLSRIRSDRFRILEYMKKEKVAAYIYPSQVVPVVKVKDPAGQKGRTGILASCLGFPAVSYPAGYTVPDENAPLGVPIGMDLLGAPGSEKLLLSLCRYLDADRIERMAPKMLR